MTYKPLSSDSSQIFHDIFCIKFSGRKEKLSYVHKDETFERKTLKMKLFVAFIVRD